MSELTMQSSPLPAPDLGEGWPATWSPAMLWLASCNTLNTRRSYASALRLFARSAQTPLAEVDSRHILAFKAAMVTRRLTPRTIRQRILILASFFGWCIEAGYHPGPNPAYIPLPRVDKSPVGRALDGGDQAALIGAATTARDRALLALLINGGLRAGEICGLQERDVWTNAGILQVHVRVGKGGQGRLVDLVDPGACQAMRQYLGDSRRRAGPSTALFQRLDGSGRGIGYWTIYRVVVEAAILAGLGHVTPHDLRRTKITADLNAGEPAPRVQRQAGHSSLEQTVHYYRFA